MGMYVQNVPVKFTTITVASGGTTYLETSSYPFPLTVTVIPGSGTGTVSTTNTPATTVAVGASSNWITWPAGAVATNNLADTLKSPVSGLRLVAATASVTFEISG